MKKIKWHKLCITFLNLQKSTVTLSKRLLLRLLYTVFLFLSIHFWYFCKNQYLYYTKKPPKGTSWFDKQRQGDSPASLSDPKVRRLPLPPSLLLLNYIISHFLSSTSIYIVFQLRIFNHKHGTDIKFIT